MRNQDVSSLSAVKRSLKTTLISSSVGLAVILLLTAAFAFLLTRTKLTDDRFYYLEFFILAAGALLSGFLAAKKGRGKGIVLGIMAGLPVMAVFLLVPYMMFEAIASSRLLLTIPVILLFSVIGGIVGANKR